MLRSRSLVAAAGVFLLGAGLLAAAPRHAPPAPEVTVYKLSTCGCCSAWVDHLRANGFEVTVHDLDDLTETNAMLGVPGPLVACHTAVVKGYVIEGHVPAADIKRLLAEHPKVAGLAVPGMPAGSPGMEGPRKDPYQVLTFDKTGKTTVFAKY
jgi:hypothetical protein